MALLIDKPAPSSTTRPVSYWNISGYSFLKDGSVNAHFEGYWTEGDRQGGASAAACFSRFFKAPPGVEVTRDWIYAEAKKLPEFDGALNV